MKKKPLTPSELDYIKDNYNKIPLSEICKKVNRCSSTILNLISSWGIGRYQWTDDRIKILKELYPSGNYELLMKNLENNNIDSIRHKSSELNIIVEKNRYYSPDEIDFLIKNYDTLSYEEIAKKLNRTLSGVYAKINNLRLKGNKTWTNEDIKLLKTVYPHYTNKYLSEKYFLNRKPESIRTMALKLGFHKTKEKSVKWYDADQMIEQLKELGEYLGRTPYGSELILYGLPSVKTFERRFDGYRNACGLANLDSNSSLFGESNTYYSTNKDLCFSKSELTITNFLIDNDINYKKEEMYNKYCEDDRCGLKRVDWVIEKNIFVEFFGMPEKIFYFERMKEKRNICNDNNIKLIEVFRKDLTKLHTIFSHYL